MKRFRLLFLHLAFALILVFSVLLNFSCRQKTTPTQTRMALGTVCRISLFENGTTELYELLFSRLKEIENEMSSTLESSEISQLNEESVKEQLSDFHLSNDTFEVLAQALEIAQLSDGAFDPSIASLVKLWDINSRMNFSEQRPLPTEDEIEKAKANCGYQYVKLNEEKQTVSFSKKGIQLELGGIAKGYAADELVKILQSKGVERALIDLGGNIYAYGVKKNVAKKNGAKQDEKNDATPWRIGIKNPFNESEKPACVISCVNKSVVTSGAYERFFEYEGKIYHHILDSKTGYPSESDLASVSIISENSMLCDCLSTTCFVLGLNKATEFMKNFPEIKYIFIQNDGEVFTNCTSELALSGNLKP